MALLQPTSKIWLWHCCSKSKHPKIFLWHGCSQAHNPNLTMALMQQKQASKILLWHCCSQARNPHHTIALLQQTNQSPIWLWHSCSTTQPLDLIMALLQPDPVPKSDCGIVAARPKYQFWLRHRYNQQPNSQIWLRLFCSQTWIPKLTTALCQQNQQFKHLSMALSQQQTTIQQCEYGNVSAKSNHNPKIWLWHYLSRKKQSKIWLWRCLNKKQQSKTLTMSVSQQKNNHNPKIWLWQCLSKKQPQSQNLTGSVFSKKTQPQSQNLNCGIVAATNPKPTPEYGIVAEQKQHPTSDCGIVAAKPKSHIWLWHCCSKTHIPHLSMAL